MITVYVGGWNSDFSDLNITHINLPATESNLSDTLSSIGVSITEAQNGSDYYIKGIHSELSHIAHSISFTDDLLRVNHLAQTLSDMDKLDQDKLNAACVLKKCDNTAELLTLAARLDDYEYLPAGNDKELGEFELEVGGWDVPLHVLDCVDCKKLGRETRQRQGGVYVGLGYIYKATEQNMEHNADEQRYGNDYESGDEEWER